MTGCVAECTVLVGGEEVEDQLELVFDTIFEKTLESITTEAIHYFTCNDTSYKIQES